MLALLVWQAVMPGDLLIQWISILFAFLLGWWATRYYERYFDQHDPKEVVVDELVGMWMVLSCLSFYPGVSYLEAVIGFLLFRLFDIWKPFPIGWLDRKVPGAFGTMIDDVVAGLFAILVIFVATRTGIFPLRVID